jgi:RNA polymerase-binding transcription factor DksA
MIDWLMLKEMSKASKRRNQQLISKENSEIIEHALSLREQSVKMSLDAENNILQIMQDILAMFNDENKSLIDSIGEKIINVGYYGNCRICGKHIPRVNDIKLARCEKSCDLNYDIISEWCYNHPSSFHYRYGLGKILNKHGGEY